MTLRDALQARLLEANANRPPEIGALFADGVARVRAAGIAQSALAVGDSAADFTLPDATGSDVALSELLGVGPVILCFYRGGWCPYCSLELRAYEALLPELSAAGAVLVAISPQTPDASLTTAQKQNLTFSVLSDVGNVVAGAFGLVHGVEPAIAAAYKRSGHDLPGGNAQPEDDITLPLPATYLIDQQGQVHFAFVSADYTERAEPADVLAAVRGL